jgi:hypothetical protein
MRNAFGIFVAEESEDVEVVFSAAVAWRIEERVFHPGEEKERLPDGRLRYRTETGSKSEILAWVSSFCGGPELIAPAAWREELSSQAQVVSARHSSKP